MVESDQTLSRRQVLRLSALAAAGAVVVACGERPPRASQVTATAPGTIVEEVATIQPEEPSQPVATAPVRYNEAPLLAQMVRDGKLPPVDERLPTNPYVPPHAWLSTGNYGGTLQMSNSWGGDGVGLEFQEHMYGHSPLRYLKDGLDIGPGLVDEWEASADARVWTLHFREGIKWSDGVPFTVSDIMYWWEDMVLDEDHSDGPPDEARSGTGTLATFTAVDELTLRLTFDAPAPLTADRLAMWVNAGIGPRWVTPRHYLEQFHPRYNTTVKDFVTHDLKMSFAINPDCPVLTGWRLAEYKEGIYTIWGRNPYYWAVDREGKQLPYIDRVVVTGYQDPQIELINILAGKVDWTRPGVVGLTDAAALKQAESPGRFEVRFWDGGSGTGQAFFFNYDFEDDAMRALIREPKFRQALSLAMNRDEIQKNFTFNTGEKTTGTFSPKAIEYNVNDEGRQRYAEWRDSFVAYNPERARALLDEIGVRAGANGLRTLSDGTPLTVQLVYSPPANTMIIGQNELMARDWQAIGIDARPVPLPPDGRTEQWRAGKVQSQADWGIGDGPNHLVYPHWLVPIDADHWAPLEGKLYELRGTEKVDANLREVAEPETSPWERQPPRLEAEPGGPIENLWMIYNRTLVEPDAMKRHRLVWDMIKIHVAHGPFVQGSVCNTLQPFVVRRGLLNVPKQEELALGGFTDPWIHPTPAVYDPETWYWDTPEAHH